MSQYDNTLDQLFELFKNKKTKLFSVDLFNASLEITDMKNNAKILQERLAQQKKQELSKQEFLQLFETDFQDRNTNQAIFNSIQKQSKNFITAQDLIALNQNYKLGYNNDQINFIIKYLGKSNQISNEDFVQLLQKQHH